MSVREIQLLLDLLLPYMIMEAILVIWTNFRSAIAKMLHLKFDWN